MESNHITVVYKWTAKPGMLEELVKIYGSVTEAMKLNEPDAEAVHCYVSEKDNALYVRDEVQGCGRPRLASEHHCSLSFSSVVEGSDSGLVPLFG